MRQTALKLLMWIVPVIVLLFRSVPCLAVVHGDAELLKIVAMQHKANFESILTWQGEAIEEKTSTQGDRYNYHLRNTCVFAYDRVRQAVRWNKETEKTLCVIDGKQIDDFEAGTRAAMIRGDSFYNYRRTGPVDDKSRSLSISSARRGVSQGEFGLDPRYYFSDPQGGGTLHGRLMFLYKSAKSPKLHEWHIKREGDIVTLEVQSGKDGANASRYVFDMSRGGNLIRYSNTNPTVTNLYEYEYEQNADVWVLRSYKWTNRDSRRTPELNTVMSVTWANTIVNIPLAEDEFSIEKLGIKPGEHIHDMKVGLVYRYGETGQDGWELPKELDVPGTPTVQIDPGAEAAPEVDSRPGTLTPQANETLSAPLEGAEVSTYIYFCVIIVIAVVLAGVAYKIARRPRKE